MTRDAENPTTRLRTGKCAYNYAEFLMQAQGEAVRLQDGHAVVASVLTLKEELLVRNVRMIFIKDTPPENACLAARNPVCLHVMAIPRISLNVVHHLATGSSPLPYEMIVAAVYSGM